MKQAMFKIVAIGFALAMSTTGANAQSSDDEFLACMIACQEWEPDTATVQACENWCYATYNPD